MSFIWYCFTPVAQQPPERSRDHELLIQECFSLSLQIESTTGKGEGAMSWIRESFPFAALVAVLSSVTPCDLSAQTVAGTTPAFVSPQTGSAQSSPGFRSPSIVVGGGLGAADRDESPSYGLLVTGSFRLFLTRSLGIEADVTRISSPYADEDAEWSVAAGLVARTPPRRVSAFGSGGFSTQGFYFGGGIDVGVAGPLLAYVQTRLGPSGYYTWQFIGGIRYIVR